MLHRSIYRIHLWTGIALGLYVLVMSISGSAIVARRELVQWLTPQFIPVAGERMTREQIDQALPSLYSGYRILDVQESLRPVRGSGYGRGEVNPLLARPHRITLERDGIERTRLFDPYTGKDLGDEQPWMLSALNWTIDLHANLLAGDAGRNVSGYCSVAFVMLLATGFVIWSRRGRRYLLVHRQINWRRQILQLHGAMGFWMGMLLLLWAVSGIYLAFPTEISMALEFVFPVEDDFNERVDRITAWLATMHFGRFGGLGVRWTWIILGLVPAALFVTGFILWWNSVVKPWHRRWLQQQGSHSTAEEAS